MFPFSCHHQDVQRRIEGSSPRHTIRWSRLFSLETRLAMDFPRVVLPAFRDLEDLQPVAPPHVREQQDVLMRRGDEHRFDEVILSRGRSAAPPSAARLPAGSRSPGIASRSRCG